MDSETDTDTISLCDSEASRENYKSPESSDCEGYATPLASSLTDIAGAITVNVPEDDTDTVMDSGERTPKPKILVMTQREIHDESSEEEYFDADVQIRDVAQQLLDGVEDDNVTCGETEERADTPIMELETEQGTETEEVVSEEEGRVTPVQFEDPEVDGHAVENEETESDVPDDETMSVVQDVTDDILSEVEKSETEEMSINEATENAVDEIVAAVENSTTQGVSENIHAMANQVDEEETKAVVCLDIKQVDEPEQLTDLATEEATGLSKIALVSEITTDVLEVLPTNGSQVMLNCESTFDNCINSIANNLITECVQNTQTTGEEAEKLPEDVQISETVVEPSAEQENDVVESKTELMIIAVPENMEISFVAVAKESVLGVSNEVADPAKIALSAEKKENIESEHLDMSEQNPEECQLQNLENIRNAITTLPEMAQIQETAEHRPVDLYEQMPEVFSEITVANTPDVSIPSVETSVACNQETIHNEPMTTLVNSDEVKTSLTSPDIDMFTDCSPHEVKVDFDGYSSGKEESLSSSTSSESFEFAEPVSSSHVQDEKQQALRNSIIERYPSNDTDDDDLDSVGDDFDEDLLAVKQISAEVEQLVAAINAFGRDEEQQMSAYLVGKKMAAEKKRKSAMDTGVVTSPCHDQTVQTDNDSFILVDRHLPIAMESLQIEIDKLQADLEKVKCGEKELLKINSQLKVELEESQQTIDGIEVEAEQQYTELTSEIDELCEIVQRKDQELANIKEKVANLSVSELNLKDDVDSQRVIVQRQKEIIESLREELDAITKKLGDVTKARDKAIEEATIYKMKNMERDRFLQREAQMSMEIEDLQRELNKQRLILNQTSMAKLADTFDRKVLHLENELRERDMLICKQNQIINSHRKSPTGSVITHRKMQPRASVLAAAGNLPSAGSSSESFQNGLDADAKEALLSFILSDRHNQLANIYNIGRILDLTPQEERSVERHLTKDRFA